ncbi:MAG TPA: serine hydrolase domain-containing protein, partial [Steroidobacteraceae bacterium]|nr:serine hydrolase domain-containing protein [Steroidobacteraceae bacterium]
DVVATVAATVDPLIESELEATGTPGAAFVFVHDGKIVHARGYGVPDLASDAKVDPARTVWPIASISKAVTAMAVLQLVDDGRVDLDADVNRYLKRLQVPSAGMPPLTLRHLLSHTGALDELPGRQFDGHEPQDLSTFLRDRIVRYRAPGELTAYSTYGILLAALVLEDQSGERYDQYLRENVFAPAGMASARVMTRRGDERGVATPYRIEDGQAEPMSFEWYFSAPASSIVATAEDMGRLLLVHLAGGRADKRRILSEKLTHAMHEQQATVHAGVPGWGLGLQMDRVNGRDIAEHGGDIGGFSALFVLIPKEDAAFFIVNHGEGSDLRFKVKDALLDRLYPAKQPPVVPPARAEDSARLAEYAGEYLSSIACRSCPRTSESVFRVAASPDGTLALWGQRWIPSAPDLFIRDDGRGHLGFARDAAGRLTAVSAGSWRVADRVR